jgi:hypothetical protein
VPTSYLPIPRTSGPNGVGPTTFDADVLGRLDALRRWGLDLDRMADYVLFREGASYRASGALGLLFGPEPGAVLQNVIATLGTRAGYVVITGDEDFEWGSVPAVLAGYTGRLTIEVRGRSKINLSANGPRFLDCAATGSTQKVSLSGVVVDATNAPRVAGQGHALLFGNNRAGVLYNQIDFRSIRIRNCEVLNASSAAGEHTGVYLATQQTAAGQPRNVIEDIRIENLRVNGCIQAATIIGFKSGTWTGEPDIWGDDIFVDGWYHHLGSAATGFAASSHVHIGGRMQVGRVYVGNGYGFGSRDVGVEINQHQDATVENVVCEEYNGFSVLLTNHRPVRRLRDQHAVVRNVAGRHLAENNAVISNASSVVAVVQSAIAANPMGSVDVEGGKYYSNRPNLQSIDGYALRASEDFRSITVKDFESHWVGINHTSATAVNPRAFYFAPSASALVRLRRSLSVAEGTAAAGAAPINLYHFVANGQAVLDWDDPSVRMDITGASDFGHRGVQIGTVAGANIKGTIDRFKVLSAAATRPKGVSFAGTSTLTIPNEIRVQDADLSAMPSGSVEVDLTGQTKVRLEGTKWRVFPLPPVGVTVGASPWIYQATQGYREHVIVSGGTVSLIEFSRDGATWLGLGETAGMFVVDPGDQLRITHTAAPTVTRVPAK